MQQQWRYLPAVSALQLALDRAVGTAIDTIVVLGVGGAITTARPDFVGVLEHCLYANMHMYLHQDIE